MEGFDASEVYHSYNLNGEPPVEVANFQRYKKKFKEFLRQFHEGNFNYKYRDTLKRNYNLGQYWIEINLDDLVAYDESLSEKIKKQPTEYLPIFEEAAKEVADEITAPRPKGEDKIEDIQILLASEDNCISLRGMKPDKISKLVKISGIIISATGIKARASKISIQCRSCKNVISNIEIKPGLESYPMPRECTVDQVGRQKCPLDPYFIMPDKCVCNDFQTLKLQELHSEVPQGEIPRHTLLYADRYLCDRVVPGNRVEIQGILSIKKIAKTGIKTGSKDKASVGIRTQYIRVVGIHVEGENSGSGTRLPVTSQEEEMFRRLAADPNLYERISKSIAPSIFGATDMKKAIACLLFGGSRKRMPDGLCRRGDINVLMLGDPGTAKSQLLKFVENVAPVAVYTSGKGSSAAGLTASVTRDAATRNFVMEGGAMVLADGGVVCIDEFDKMKEDDRVAIHEAMEQQTISIAKAGITTTLNTRCSVLAAANSTFGRWDDTKGDANLDFMPTILSRFDMIFIVKDEHEKNRDETLARHVLSIHSNAEHTDDTLAEGELPVATLRKYVHYCRTTCGPRLTESASEKLRNHYVMLRSKANPIEGEKKNPIPITVRQLEAVIRISESLAKMRLLPFASEVQVDEALRLFRVSTISAASAGFLSGVEGFTTQEDFETLTQIEKQLKKRFAVGTQVSEQNIISDFVQKQKYPERAVRKVIYSMIGRGELQHRMQRKMLYRLF